MTSSNENVATIIDDIISAITVGRTVIEVKTEDGGYTDTMIIEVINPKKDSSSAFIGTLGGTLLDSNDNPISGYTTTLYSDPCKWYYWLNGKYSFGVVPYTTHTLVI